MRTITMRKLTTVKIPTWAVCYLTYGDAGDLNETELCMVDDWYTGIQETHKVGYFMFNFPEDIDEAKDFDSSPEFGLACDTVATELWTND